MRFELIRPAKKLINDVFEIKEGEEVVLTYDTLSDLQVVQITAAAAVEMGAKPVLICVPAPDGVGKAADPQLPLRTLSAALEHCDVWIEFNERWLLYSTVYEQAMKNNNLRYMCLVGMNSEMMQRTLDLDLRKLREFLKKVTERISKARKVRITTAAGTDINFENHPHRPVICDSGEANLPGIYMLPGQISWSPVFESINGKIVFDGSLVPPAGILREPVELTIENGEIKRISGGTESIIFKKWLESFKHRGMFRLAHISLGFNPGAKLTGNVLEDERVWGCSEWGIGYIGEDMIPDIKMEDQAPSHCDGVCLNSTIILDDAVVVKNGVVVDEELMNFVPK
ncbi:aminopeptidase [Pseudothermotoga sp.]|uniref:aminopeptidase n=1 Tax=Pseudothermotoga sp. TaxID=2033661 RepID=UPI000E857D44|nr:aminopeptidase [Pseudothermotoga sp.]HBJ81076.1 leucyl aminopeptidase [Pseudothermotoga sp.]